MEQGEEGQPDTVAARLVRLSRIPGVLAFAYADARGGVGRRHPVDDQLGAAMVDVVKRRHDRQPRRVEPDLNLDLDRGGSFAETEQHRAGGGNADQGRSGAQVWVCLAVEGARDPHTVWSLLSDRGIGRTVEREKGKGRPILLDAGLEGQQLGGRCLDRGIERRGATDQGGGGNDFDGGAIRTPGGDPQPDTQRHDHNERQGEQRAKHASMI